MNVQILVCLLVLCPFSGNGLKLQDQGSLDERLKKLEATLANIQKDLVEKDVGGSDSTRRPLKRSLAERLRYLEHKVDGQANWLKDPQLWRKTQHGCQEIWDVGTGNEHHICLDSWKAMEKKRKAEGRPCIVYDLGVRAQPQFGENLLADPYNCKVRAYDPSPVSKEWWTTSKLQKHENYTFHPFAAGGEDGHLELFESDWNQVNIFKQEWDDHTIWENVDGDERKRYQTQQRSFFLDAKTLPTMMEENGDTYIDIMKVDIEGSEYMFLQDIFDRMGCPPVGQITLEYHYFQLDERYGSSPELNTLHNLLNSCGFKSFRVRDHWKNWVTEDKHGKNLNKFHIEPKRYTLVSFCKDC